MGSKGASVKGGENKEANVRLVGDPVKEEEEDEKEDQQMIYRHNVKLFGEKEARHTKKGETKKSIENRMS